MLVSPNSGNEGNDCDDENIDDTNPCGESERNPYRCENPNPFPINNMGEFKDEEEYRKEETCTTKVN